MVIFCLPVWKGAANSKKKKRILKDNIKKQWLEWIIINEAVESEELNREVEGVQDPEEAAMLIQKYEHIIRAKKKGIITMRIINEKFLKSSKTEKSLCNWPTG